MLPSNNIELTKPIQIKTQPSKTYYMTNPHIKGYCDEIDAIRQAVFKILNTERYEYIIYSWNYGIQLKDLYGMPYDYCCIELQRRITESLEWDKRITSVDEFEFTKTFDHLLATFTVHSIYGDFKAEKGVQYV